MTRADAGSRWRGLDSLEMCCIAAAIHKVFCDSGCATHRDLLAASRAHRAAPPTAPAPSHAPCPRPSAGERRAGERAARIAIRSTTCSTSRPVVSSMTAPAAARSGLCSRVRVALVAHRLLGQHGVDVGARARRRGAVRARPGRRRGRPSARLRARRPCRCRAPRRPSRRLRSARAAWRRAPRAPRARRPPREACSETSGVRIALAHVLAVEQHRSAAGPAAELDLCAARRAPRAPARARRAPAAPRSDTSRRCRGR